MSVLAKSVEKNVNYTSVDDPCSYHPFTGYRLNWQMPQQDETRMSFSSSLAQL